MRLAALALAAGLLAGPGALGAQWSDVRVPTKPALDSAAAAAGRAVYELHCWYCHGVEGDGRGPVAEHLWPRPRDFVEALYKLRTTESGALPTDEDLYRTVTHGMPGTAMPGWREALTPAERWQVVAYLKTFAEDLFGDPVFDPYASLVPVERPPRIPEDSLLAWGRRVYEQAECFECHGVAGRGEGIRADSLQDAEGRVILPTDLHRREAFRGGATLRDIYLRVTAGMDGTPMPAQDETFTAEERWAVAAWVRHLQEAEGSEPRPSPVITARRTDEGLPLSPDDERWADAPASLIHLSGQATFPPRWQVPSVRRIEVRAMFDDDAVALHVRWHDRFPDTVPVADPPPEGWAADDTYPQLFVGVDEPLPGYPDELEILFPVRYQGGPRLPHFVYGDSTADARVWRWSAAASPNGPTPLQVLRGRGAAAPPEPEAEESSPQAVARGLWAEGRWSVVLRIPMEDLPASARSRTAHAPIAFHVREGRIGETGLRMAVSSWQTLYFAEPTRASHLLTVLAVVAGVLLLQGAVVATLRRKAHRGELSRYGLAGTPPRRPADEPPAGDPMGA